MRRPAAETFCLADREQDILRHADFQIVTRRRPLVNRPTPQRDCIQSVSSFSITLGTPVPVPAQYDLIGAADLAPLNLFGVLGNANWRWQSMTFERFGTNVHVPRRCPQHATRGMRLAPTLDFLDD